MNEHLWKGKYSTKDAYGKRISHNVYAKIREECKEKLAAMLEEVKNAIAAEKEKMHLIKYNLRFYCHHDIVIMSFYINWTYCANDGYICRCQYAVLWVL